MRVRPCRFYSTPSYPTAEELRERPELLERVPRRWARLGAASLLGATIGVGSGCASRSEGATAPTATAAAAPGAGEAEPPPAVEASPAPDAGPAAEAAPAAPPSPAPSAGGGPPAVGRAVVFERGEGRGAVGCVAIAPPVFLTEDEAWGAIRDELSAAGLSLARGGPTLPAVRMPVFEDCGDYLGPGGPQSLALDGVEAARGVAVEFVSADDHDQMWQQPLGCSVQDYRFLQAAQELAREIGQPRGLVVGVFYDPSTSICFGRCPDGVSGQPSEAAARAKSLADLRGQVRQFVDFLRASGTI